MALRIPSLVLKQLYTFGSLTNDDNQIRFSVKNRLSDAALTGLQQVKIDNDEVPTKAIFMILDDGSQVSPAELADKAIDFPLRQTLVIVCQIEPLSVGKHRIEVHFETKPFGKLKLKVEDAIS